MLGANSLGRVIMPEPYSLPWENRADWSHSERVVARKAFDQAYGKRCGEIIQQVRKMLDRDGNPWSVHEYLSKERRKVDNLFDYRYSQLMQVFGVLIADNQLALEDLAGLREDKLERIRQHVSYFRRETTEADKAS
jgi:hypothetical protein